MDDHTRALYETTVPTLKDPHIPQMQLSPNRNKPLRFHLRPFWSKMAGTRLPHYIIHVEDWQIAQYKALKLLHKKNQKQAKENIQVYIDGKCWNGFVMEPRAHVWTVLMSICTGDSSVVVKQEFVCMRVCMTKREWDRDVSEWTGPSRQTPVAFCLMLRLPTMRSNPKISNDCVSWRIQHLCVWGRHLPLWCKILSGSHFLAPLWRHSVDVTSQGWFIPLRWSGFALGHGEEGV